MAELNSIDELLRAIHNSVIEAQKLTEQQHIRQLRSYFKEDGTPITKLIKLPNPHYDPSAPKPAVGSPPVAPGAKRTSDEYIDFNAPLLSLVPPTSIRIKQLKVNFKMRIRGFVEGDEKTTKDAICGKEITHKGALHVELSSGIFSSKSELADISIIFEGTEPPESVLKINDHFVRAFP